HPFVSSVKTNRPLRELVAEAKAEVMEEIEDNHEEGEEEEAADITSASAKDPSATSLNGDHPHDTSHAEITMELEEELESCTTPLKEQEDNLSDKLPEEDPDKPESEASGKASSSDSGIEDGKSSPISEVETKVTRGSENPEIPTPKSTEPAEHSSESTECAADPEKTDWSGTLATQDSHSTLMRTHSKAESSRMSVMSDRSSLAGEDFEGVIPHTNGRLSNRFSDLPSESMDISLNSDLAVGKDLATISLRHSKKTLKRTRRFHVDGVEVSVTTSKIISDDEKKDEEMSLKQKEQYDQMLRRFDQEMNAKKKHYDIELETLEKQQKQSIEKMELEHSTRLRDEGRRIRMEQEREHARFLEQMKHKKKEVKQEVEKLPRRDRKNTLKIRMSSFQLMKSEEEVKFIADQKDFMDATLKSIITENKREISETERQFLLKKQSLIREREATIWELEEKNLHEKHQLLKQQLKDQYFLKRHQLLKKHDKEQEQMLQYNLRMVELLKARQQQEKNRLPRIQRNEAKTRMVMFKKSLKIQSSGSAAEDRERIKQFSRLEEKRQKAERLHQQQKHENQMREMLSQSDSNSRELQQLQVLEDDLNQKKMEQEHFFKMSKENDCVNIGSPSRFTKFVPYVDSSST
ncbi:hypothetical protein DNTS_034962, partial [Danionella cerebrum]